MDRRARAVRDRRLRRHPGAARRDPRAVGIASASARRRGELAAGRALLQRRVGVGGLDPAYAFDGEDVTWHVDADGYRLPTEAEWEYACRAGSTGPHYGPLAEVAWTAADGVSTPQHVGGKLPNLNGLFDTLGNVWEWCWDLLDPARYDDYRVFRGGGFADDAWSVRASTRRGGAPRMSPSRRRLPARARGLRRDGCCAGLVGGGRPGAGRPGRTAALRLDAPALSRFPASAEHHADTIEEAARRGILLPDAPPTSAISTPDHWSHRGRTVPPRQGHRPRPPPRVRLPGG